MTSRNDFTSPLRELRVAKSQTLVQHGPQLHTAATSRSNPQRVPNPCAARIVATFHFPPPTGVGVTPIRRPLPRLGWDAQTRPLKIVPLSVIGGVR